MNNLLIHTLPFKVLFVVPQGYSIDWVHKGVHGVVHGLGVHVLYTSCMHDDDY